MTHVVAGICRSSRRQWLRVGLAVVISTLTMAMLFRLADATLLSGAWRTVSPLMLAVASALFLANLAARGLRLMLLAAVPGTSAGFFPWLRLSVAHQLVFMLLPSGMGDVGFPYLASRIVGLDAMKAAGTVFIYRLQDIWLLLLIGAIGFTLMSIDQPVQLVFFPAMLLLVAAGLAWSSDLARWSAIIMAGLLRGSVRAWGSRRLDGVSHVLARFAQGVGAPISRRHRFAGAGAAIAGWAAAAMSFWAVFGMIGVDLDPAETLVVVAGLNLVGAFASFTIAGFGVSEGGLAGLLMILGFEGPEAIAVALVARPLLLANALLVCGATECAFRLLYAEPPRPHR